MPNYSLLYNLVISKKSHDCELQALKVDDFADINKGAVQAVLDFILVSARDKCFLTNTNLTLTNISTNSRG